MSKRSRDDQNDKNEGEGVSHTGDARVGTRAPAAAGAGAAGGGAVGAAYRTPLAPTDEAWAPVLVELQRVPGIGEVKAGELRDHDIRSIEELRAAVGSDRSMLTAVQHIGLQYLEDTELRIPRDEVTEIFGAIVDTANRLDAELIVYCCGSYRRGKKLCGDMDVLESGLRHDWPPSRGTGAHCCGPSALPKGICVIPP